LRHFPTPSLILPCQPEQSITPPSLAQWPRNDRNSLGMSECWLSFTSSASASFLFVAVDDLKPNRRYAVAFKFLPRLCEWQSHED
jgi:hypothetical protein